MTRDREHAAVAAENFGVLRRRIIAKDDEGNGALLDELRVGADRLAAVGIHREGQPITRMQRHDELELPLIALDGRDGLHDGREPSHVAEGALATAEKHELLVESHREHAPHLATSEPRKKHFLAQGVARGEDGGVRELRLGVRRISLVEAEIEPGVLRQALRPELGPCKAAGNVAVGAPGNVGFLGSASRQELLASEIRVGRHPDQDEIGLADFCQDLVVDHSLERLAAAQDAHDFMSFTTQTGGETLERPRRRSISRNHQDPLQAESSLWKCAIVGRFYLLPKASPRYR